MSACARNNTLACIGGVYAFVDKHPDGNLNTAELSRLMRILIHLGIVIQDEARYGEGAGGVLGGLAVPPILSTAIIAFYHYNGDNSVSLKEITDELAGMGQIHLVAGSGGVQDRAREVLNSIRSNVDQLLPMLMQIR